MRARWKGSSAVNTSAARLPTLHGSDCEASGAGAVCTSAAKSSTLQTPSLHVNHQVYHRCAFQALRSSLAHHSPTIAQLRHMHHNQTVCGSSYGQPIGSDCHLGWACHQVRHPSQRAWRRRVPVDRDRRVDGRSSGSGGMIPAWLSHGVTFCASIHLG